MDHRDLQRVAADFGTPLIGHDDRYALYGRMHVGGREKLKDHYGGLILNVAGAWQFVGHAPPSAEDGLRETRIAQWVVPRFVLAAAADEVTRLAVRRPSCRPLVCELGAGLTLVAQEDESLAFGVTSEGLSWTTPMPSEIRMQLASELRLLDAARAAAVADGKRFRLPAVKTGSGHPIVSKSRQLIEAVSFEKAAGTRLSRGTFGVYAVYCVERDTKAGAFRTARYIDQLIDGIGLLRPEETGRRYAALCKDVQTALFRKPIWGDQVSASRDAIGKGLSDVLEKLTSPQRAQFTLLQEMNPANVLLHLGFVTGHVRLGQLLDLVTACYAPDSPQERYIRTKLAFIAFYGAVS